MTFNQLVRRQQPRIEKRSKSRSPRLEGKPQIKGVCRKVYTTTPKKPNSAIRRIAKVRLSTKRNVLVYIPGVGSNSLREYSQVMIRGGRVPDLPGVKYRVMRGLCELDWRDKSKRRQGRSKFHRRHPVKHPEDYKDEASW